MKRLCIFLLILIIFEVYAEPAAAHEGVYITFNISDESPSVLIDEQLETSISFEKGEVITINPCSAVGMLLKWYEPCIYTIELIDDKGRIRKQSYDDLILNKYIELAGSRTVRVELLSEGRLCDIEFFFKEPPAGTQMWEEPFEKLDILVISAHPDDEYLYFGGTLPYYGKELGLNVSVVWMSHQRRVRQEEALNGLWAMGIRNYPEFVSFPDVYSRSYKDGARNWGEDKTLSAIVGLYRKYKPEVVLTHDLNGEYGHGAHMVTSAMALKAVAAAADKSQYPESMKKYGSWQIKKLYLHLYKKNRIYMAWDMRLKSFGGKTALQMAKIGFRCHKTQQKPYLKVETDSQTACTKFGLAFSMVGIDIHCNDFLENIAENNLSNYGQKKPYKHTPYTINKKKHGKSYSGKYCL